MRVSKIINSLLLFQSLPLLILYELLVLDQFPVVNVIKFLVCSYIHYVSFVRIASHPGVR